MTPKGKVDLYEGKKSTLNGNDGCENERIYTDTH